MSLPKVETLRSQLVLLRDIDYGDYKGYKETLSEFVDTIDTLIGALDDTVKKHRTKEQDRVTYELMTRLVINLLLEVMTHEVVVPSQAKRALQAQRQESK